VVDKEAAAADEEAASSLIARDLSSRPTLASFGGH